MNDFWKSYDITHAEYGADYRCYPLYGTVHLMELAISLAFIVGAALWYRRSSARTRRRILVGVTALLLLDEAALLLGMALTGQWNWSYLPLHLCNINVFVCLYNTITDRNWCKEELYALCIPGAMLALLCPSWLDVPSWWTLINLHSVSIHALLVLYPVLLVAGGYRPSPRRVPQVLVHNKCDLLQPSRQPRQTVDWVERANGTRVRRAFVSARDGSGLAALREVLADTVRERLNAPDPAPSSPPDARALRAAVTSSIPLQPPHHG